MRTRQNTDRRMSFECDKSWEELTVVEGGRHCSDCNKCLTDYRALSRAELLAKENIGCGVFTLEQVEPDLTPLNFTPIRRTVFTIGAVLSLGLLGSSAQEVPAPDPTVQVENTELVSRKDPHPVLRSTEILQEDVPSKPVAKNKSSRYYLSKRFPFLHRRMRRNICGFL